MRETAPPVDLRLDHWAIVRSVLRQHVPNREVLAFGSRATWTAKNYSDLDLAILGDEQLPLDVSSALAEAFSESDLPFKVDLVDWSRIEDTFRNIIRRDGVTLQIPEVGSRVADPACRPLASLGEWRATKWGDEISLEYGKAIRGYRDVVAPYRVYGTNGPVGFTDSPLVPRPGVILGRKGAYRGVHYSPDPFSVIDTAYYVKPKSSDLDMRWLYYAITYYALGEIDDGSPVPSTTRAAVYVRDLAVPPLQEQEAIAQFLGSLDDKINLNRQMNETLEAMARAIFKDWFVDFGPTRAKAEGRAPYLAPEFWDLFPDKLDDEGTPEGWETKPLKDCLERLKVGKLYDQKSVLPTGRVPVLDQGKSGIIGFHDNEANIQASPKRRIAIFANHTCLQRLLDFNFSTIQNVIPFVGRQLPTEWVHYASLDKQKFEEYRGHWPSFIVHSVTVPTTELASTYAQLVDPLILKISVNQTEAKTLTQTRDCLLPKLMTGEIRLADAESAVEAAA